MAKEIKFSIKLNIDGKEQFGTVTTSTKELAKSLDDAKSKATRFQDVMVRFSSVSTVLKNTSEAIGKLSEKMSELNSRNLAIQQQTGLTGEAMAEMRNEVQAVASTYGKEFSEVLSGVSTIMKGFGISSDEAMRLVRDGLMSGADATGQMFDILKEYPAYFKEAGLTAEQFMAVITNGANMGVFNDKAADTIKEGNLRLREMTTATAAALDAIGLNSDQIQTELRSGMTSTFEVMQRVGAKLKELPQTSSEVGTALADIFGGPGEDAGVAYIESLADMELGMSKLKDSASDNAKAMDVQVDGLTKMNNILMAVVDQFNVLPSLQPFLNITSEIGMTLVGVSSLVSSLKALNIIEGITAARTAAVSAANVLARNTTLALRAVSILAGNGFKTAAVGATTLKIAIKGLLISTGVGAAIVALTTAIEYFINKADKSKDAADDAADGVSGLGNAVDTAKQAFDGTLEQSLGNLMTQYTKLQGAWKNLTTAHSKNQWIRDNQSAFRDLGLSVKNIADAEDVFAKNTAKVEDAFRRRAEAAAYAAQLQSLYEQKIRLETQKERLVGAAQKRLVKEGDTVQDGSLVADMSVDVRNGHSPYFTRDKDGNRRYTDYGATMENINRTATPKTDAELRSVKSQIESTLGHMKQLAAAGEYTPTRTVETRPGMTGKAGGTTTTGKQFDMGSIAWYEERIKGLNDQIQTSGDTSKVKDLVTLRDEYAAALKDFKIDVGLEKPDAREVKTYIETLQDQLREAQRSYDSLDGSATVEARVEAQAKISEIQAQIDTATNGQLSIPAEVEPQYIAQGSMDDRRRSYQNAQSKAGRIQSDFGAGLIDKTEAERQIADLNKEISEKLGKDIKPLKLDVDTSGTVHAMDAIKEGWSNISGIEGGIKGITDALSGQQDAWSVISGVINGAISVAEGIQGIVQLINSLTGATNASSAASTAKASSTAAETSATIANTAATVQDTAASLANTAAKSGEAITNVTASGAKMPYPMNIVAIATGVAAVIAALAMVGSFASGGIVGGNSKTGDKLIARVNSGEMILNSQQQSRLFGLLNGKYTIPTPQIMRPQDRMTINMNTPTAAAETGTGGRVQFKIRGNSLVGIMANTTRIGRKSGRRSKIVI